MNRLKLLYPVIESAELISVSRTRLYELIGDGQIESIKIGRSRLIPAEALERFVAERRAAAVQESAEEKPVASVVAERRAAAAQESAEGEGR